MNEMQWIAIVEIAIFYTAYLLKMIGQKRKGIQTNQLGKGTKINSTLRVEKLLQLVSGLVVPIELISIIMNTTWILNEKIRYIGLFITMLGVLFFMIAMITMRDSWRAGIPDKDETEIVTNGIYKLSRNPAFLGFDLTYIGIFLVFSNPILLVVSLFVIGAMHLQILEEEKFMKHTFGETYQTYKRRTGRYFIVI